MIRYALVCDKSHDFEIWFKNSADYDRQRKRALVSCPACGSTKVEKALMAPSLGRSSKSSAMPEAPVPTPAPAPVPDVKSPVAMMSPQESEIRSKLKELRDHLLKNADNVGTKFPEVAR